MKHPLSEQLRQLSTQGCAIDQSALLLSAADELDMLYTTTANGKAEAEFLDNEHLKKELLNMSVRAAEYEPVLQLIAIGPRADGTYNYCRKACQQLAQKALSHD